jgi:hypothetical protein
MMRPFPLALWQGHIEFCRPTNVILASILFDGCKDFYKIGSRVDRRPGFPDRVGIFLRPPVARTAATKDAIGGCPFHVAIHFRAILILSTPPHAETDLLDVVILGQVFAVLEDLELEERFIRNDDITLIILIGATAALWI